MTSANSSNPWAIKSRNKSFAELIRSPDADQKQEHSRDWFRKRAMEAGQINAARLTSTMSDRMTSKLIIGRMYLYWYDAKLKDKLPYWDRFPLVFPIGQAEGGFYGLNLHYLPYMMRAKLMDALYTTLNNDKMNETTKIRANYALLKRAAKFKYFRPCIKHYLTDHIESRFLNIPADQWDIALFLPLERFQKATKQRVFAESMAKIRKG
jgi:hypothetical protein